MRSVNDQMHRTIKVVDVPKRIISLVPAQTELLHDLGLGDRVVGVTKFCTHPEAWQRTKPLIGGTKKLNIQQIRSLRPDLIFGNKEENTPSDIEELELEFPVWMSDVRDLEGALDMIRRVGQITATVGAAESMARRIHDVFNEMQVPQRGLSAAYVIWRDPIMTVGHNTFIHDMLLRCGLRNAFGDCPIRYPELTANELAAAAPDIILLPSEPFPFAEQHLAEMNRICPKATVLLVDGELFGWYGSRLLQAPAYMNGVIGGLKIELRA